MEFWQTFSARVYLANQSREFQQMSPLLMDTGRADGAQRERMKLYAPVLAEVRQAGSSDRPPMSARC